MGEVVKPWNRLSKELVESMHLELFKSHVDVAFRDTVSWWICRVAFDNLKGVFQSKQFSDSHSLSPQLSLFPTVPILPWQPPALLAPLDDCPIFFLPGNNPPFYLPT